MDISTDGYVGAPDGDVAGWIFPSFEEELEAYVVGVMEQTGTHVMGRQAYDDMSSYWPTSDDAYAPGMNETPKVVVSTTLESPEWQHTTVAPELVPAIEGLKADGTEGAIVAHGGVTLVRSLLDEGLADELHLYVRPVVLGDGLRLFDARRDLDLAESRRFPGGALVNVFTV